MSGMSVVDRALDSYVEAGRIPGYHLVVTRRDQICLLYTSRCV